MSGHRHAPAPGTGGGPGRPGIRLAALGDSVTVGLGNYAVCGARVADVLRDQLPRALELRPSLATVLVGVNDTLRGDFDPAVFAADYEQLVARLSETGATVLTSTLPDPRMWGLDRLHPSERGHRQLARLFAARLGTRGLAVRLPDPEPAAPEPTAWAGAFWLATAGTAWLARRCWDFLPAFARLVAEERRQTRVAVEFACRAPAGEPRVDRDRDVPEHEGRHRGRVVPAAGERGRQLGLPHP
ncbi:GDSL-type esterase/lipase family protein [Nonomuraea sp. KM90]|uniref:GDSL-type esterase/lipase family protein n=1 Tax=Nonomuraea sp. KM90 TaxID=3457428 RepID=UPI003FCD807C